MKATISCAESCTGGNIAHKITSIAGSSEYFLGGVVSYANSVKHNVLGVPYEVLQQYGAVSSQVVELMAEGVRRLTGSDYAMATSGVAGPGGGTPEKPVGTVWIAAAGADRVVSRLYHFSGNRQEVIEASTEAAFDLLYEVFEIKVPH